MSLDQLHAHPDFIKFKDDVKNVNDEQINQIKKTAKEIIDSKDGDKKVLSKIINSYYNDLDGRKRSDINNNTEDEKIKKIVDFGVEEDKHLHKLKSDLDEANKENGLGLSAEEITILLSQPYMDKQRAQTGGYATYWDENGIPRDEYGNRINQGFSQVAVPVFAGAFLAAGICALGGPVGCIIVGSFVGINVLGIGAVVIVEATKKVEATKEEQEGGGGINEDFERYFKKGKEHMENNYSEYINSVVLPNLEKGTLLGKTKKHDPNEDTLAGLMKRLKPATGGKRRTRKAKKSKKRGTKKTKKSAKRKSRKSRR